MTTITVLNTGPIVRATVPLGDSDRIRWRSEVSPFSLRSASSGCTYPAQCERVTDDEDGYLRVAELIAVVGDDVSSTWDVIVDVKRDQAPTLDPEARDWVAAPPRWGWLDANGYQQVITTAWAPTYTRRGSECVTRKFFGSHVTGWVTVYRGLNIAEFDVIFHAAEANSPPWFFQSLWLLGGGVCVYAWPEPNADHTMLARPQSDGKCWFIPQRGMRHYRFVMYGMSAGAKSVAWGLAHGHGWGVADSWTSVPAWEPMGLPLPTIPTFDARMRQECQSQWVNNSAAITYGTTIGVGQKLGQPGGRVGLFNVWGSPYGGVTGGSDRELAHTLGICGALTGEPSSFLALQAELAMSTWRTPIGLIDALGHPETASHPGNWRISATDGRFSSNGQADGGFGFYAVHTPTLPSTIYDTDAYDRLVKTYAPHDWQHFVRAWSPAVALVMLRNDPISKFMLNCWSNVWMMSQRTDGNLLGEMDTVDHYHGHGTVWGRAQGHGWAMVAATAAFHGRPFMLKHGSMMSSALHVLQRSQMSNGFRRAHAAITKDGPMFFEPDGVTPKYAVTTPDEEVYLELAQTGLARMLHDSQRWRQTKALCDAIWFMGWNGAPGAAPSDKIAVRPVPRASLPFDVAPARNGYDVAEVALVYAIALHAGVTSPAITAAVTQLAGGTPPLPALIAKNWAKLVLDDTAFLISALQLP